MSKADPFTPDDCTRFTMRLKTNLLDKVKELAEKDKRSTAKEIEFIIEDYFRNIDESQK